MDRANKAKFTCIDTEGITFPLNLLNVTKHRRRRWQRRPRRTSTMNSSALSSRLERDNVFSEEQKRLYLLSLPILSGPLPTANELEEKVLKESEATLQRTADAFNKSSEALSQAIREARDRVRSANEELESMPEEISSIDDEMLDLRGELDGPSSLLSSLEKQHHQLQQIRAARDYLSVLAKAEDLKSQVITKDNDEKTRWGKQGALATLSQLSRLVKAAQLAHGDAPHLRGLTFAESQVTQAYEHLRKERMQRLHLALEQSGWPPPPVELDGSRAGGPAPPLSPEDMLLASSTVRRCWRDVMELQVRGAKLGLAPVPTALRGVIINKSASSSSAGAAAGSSEYEPVLAVRCLLDPLLLRFYYHFDSDRSTNRLDKPEWFLSHMLSLLRSHSSLFDPEQGAVALLCSSEKHGTSVDTTMELLHGLLRPLRHKIESSIDLLLQHPVLLSHTIMQVLRFDEDLRDLYPPAARQISKSGDSTVRLANSLLSKEAVFEAWVQGERQFTSERLEDQLSSGTAWLVGDETDDDQGDSNSTWAALNQSSTDPSTTDADSPSMKTTRSARSVVDLIDGLTARYSPLSSASQQLPFLLIQSSLLRLYAQRLERSLDAFESLSSAFARAIPGGMASSGSDGPASVPTSGGLSEGGAFGTSDSEMVQGLRGLGRLLKACLSALYVVAHLDRLSSTSFFLVLGSSIGGGEAGGGRLLADWKRFEGEEEEQELDKASLGELVRRGWRSGGRLASAARPLAASAERSSSASRSPAPRSTSLAADSSLQDGDAEVAVDVWQGPKARFQTIVDRSLNAMEKLVVGETLDNLRVYSHR